MGSDSSFGALNAPMFNKWTRGALGETGGGRYMRESRQRRPPGAADMLLSPLPTPRLFLSAPLRWRVNGAGVRLARPARGSHGNDPLRVPLPCSQTPGSQAFGSRASSAQASSAQASSARASVGGKHDPNRSSTTTSHGPNRRRGAGARGGASEEDLRACASAREACRARDSHMERPPPTGAPRLRKPRLRCPRKHGLGTRSVSSTCLPRGAHFVTKRSSQDRG